MGKKVLNIHWIIYLSIWLVFTVLCVFIYAIDIIMKEKTDNMQYAFVVLLVLFIPLLFRPVWIEFDKDALTIHFIFGFFQKINWESVLKVERIFLEKRYYRIFGDAYGRRSFFTSTKFPCNRKAQRLLREYWNEKFER